MIDAPDSALRARVRLIWRAALFVAITVVVFIWMDSYDQAMIRAHWRRPTPNFLGSAWYGPFLLMLSPLSLLWLSVGARRLWTKIVGLIFTFFAFLICLYLIWIGMSATPESLPSVFHDIRSSAEIILPGALTCTHRDA